MPPSVRLATCLLSVTCCAMCAGPVPAVTPQWTRVTPFPPLASHDTPVMVASAPDGSVYLVGTVGGQLGLTRLSSAGDVIWEVRYPGATPRAFVLNDSSAITVVAETNAHYEADFLTLRYTSSGVLEWSRVYDEGIDWPRAIALGPSGIVCVTGTTTDGSYIGDVATVAYDVDGNELWTARYDGPNQADDGSLAVAYGPDGEVFITGGSNPGGCLTLKYDAAGVLAWSRYAAPLYRGDCIIVDSSGAPTVASSTGTHTVLMRYSSAGDSLWAATVAGINPVGLVQDALGNVYTAATLYPEPPDWRVAKVGPSGNVVWELGISGPSGSRDLASSIAISGDDALYLAGQWSDSREHFMLARVTTGGGEAWKRFFDGPGDGSDGSITSGALAMSGDRVCLFTSEWAVAGHLDWSVRTLAPNGAEVWRRTLAGFTDPESVPTDIVLDDSGAPIVAGYVESAGGAGDVTATAYDADGVLRWSRRSKGLGYLGTGPSIGRDDNGAVYVSGSAANSSPDLTLKKYDAAGSLVWSAGYDGPAGKDDYAGATVVTGPGATYITGTSIASNWDYDMTTWKYSPSGALQWVRRYAGPGCPQSNRHDGGIAACLAEDSGVIVTGREDTGTPCKAGIVTIKYSPDGTAQWTAHHAVSGWHVEPYDVAADGSGVYVLGYVYNGTAVLLKYQHSGALAWSAMMSSSHAGASLGFGEIVLGPDGNAYLCGTESDSLGSGYLVVSVDGAGAERWRTTLFYEPGLWNHAAAMCIGAEGRLYVTGERNGDFRTVALDPRGAALWESGFDGGYRDYGTAVAAGMGGVYVAGRVGMPVGSAFGILRYLDALVAVGDPIETVETADSGPRVTVAGSVVRIEFGLQRASSVRWGVYDLAGRRLARGDGGYRGPGRHAIDLDGRAWPSGVLFLRWESEPGGVASRRFVLLK